MSLAVRILKFLVLVFLLWGLQLFPYVLHNCSHFFHPSSRMNPSILKDCINDKPICLRSISILFPFLHLPNHMCVVLLCLPQDVLSVGWSLAPLALSNWISSSARLWHSSIVQVFRVPFLAEPQASLETQPLLVLKSILCYEKPLLHSDNNKFLKCCGKKSLISMLCQVSKISLRMSSEARIETHFSRLRS